MLIEVVIDEDRPVVLRFRDGSKKVLGDGSQVGNDSNSRWSSDELCINFLLSLLGNLSVTVIFLVHRSPSRRCWNRSGMPRPRPKATG